MTSARALCAAMACICLSVSVVRADEADDVLNLKRRHHDRIRKFSAEFSVETDQPRGQLKNPKTVRLRYKLDMEKLPPHARKAMHQPWRVNAEVLEPQPMHLRIEGEQAWFRDQHGKWIELPMTPEIREQFLAMGERFMGGSAQEIRKHSDVRVVRKNNPVFGTKTVTISQTPKGKAKMWHRLEEDVDMDGLPRETRIFDEHGNQTVKVKVTKSKKINGVPVVEAMESESTTPAGHVLSRMTCRSIQVACEDELGGWQ